MVDKRPESTADHRTVPAGLESGRALLATFDGRALDILRERVFRFGDSVPTLQDLGDRFGLSRERVRQIESSARENVVQRAGSSPDLTAICDRVRDRLGAVFTAHDLADALGLAADPGGLPTEVLLVLFLAGPYRLHAGTFVRIGFDDELRRVVRPVVAEPVPLAEVRARMRQLGVQENQQVPVLTSMGGIRVFGDQVVPWSGSIGDKAAVVLALHQQLMTADEIHENLGEGSLMTLKNYLGSDRRFLRRGTHTWGLSDWGGEKYESIAAEMADELRERPNGMPVERLKRQLGDKFGVSHASVEIMSATHPMFVREGAWVRLRRATEPYVPDTALEEARDCFVINGEWGWRHLVTRETLRGSGHAVPEPFAAHLGVLPTTRRELTSDAGPIPLYWPAQSPGIGSLRRAAERLHSSEGDYLFVVPTGNRIEFSVVRQSDLAHDETVRQLMSRLGQKDFSGTWLSACASAIGLPRHALPEEIDDLLEVRGDREVLRLFRSALLEQRDR